MDTARWSQEMALVMKPMEEMVPSNNSSSSNNNNNNNNNMIIINNNSSSTKSQQTMERRATTTTRPQKEQALACPRCNSTNTKFCYYNNYSLTQPRYFCKTCRRYWTEGGSLRNVPVGGGSRKNKRSSSSSSSSSAAAASASSSQNPNPNPIPRKYHDGGHDLNLAFAQHGLPEFGDFSPNNNSIHHNGSAMINPNRFGPFPPMPDMRAVYPSVGFSLQEVRPPTASFSLEGINGGGVNGGDGNGYHENGGRLLFPFEELKQVQGGDPPGFWSGMNIGGGGGGGSW